MYGYFTDFNPKFLRSRRSISPLGYDNTNAIDLKMSSPNIGFGGKSKCNSKKNYISKCHSLYILEVILNLNRLIL